MGIIISILGFIFAISILTIVHEFGHFWVARRFRVKVIRFSIGFGKRLFAWHDKHGTEYVIAAVPMGGYLNLLEETEGEVASVQEQHMAFNRKPLSVRLAIICAGPAANILFALLTYWLVFMLGVSTLLPLLGTIPKGSVADLAKLQRGQEIISINEKPTSTWEDISVALIPHLGGKDFVKIKTYERATDAYSDHIMDLTAWSLDNKEGDILKSLGVAPFDPIPPIVGKLLAGYPAKEAGLLVGDLILEADGIEVINRTQLTSYLRTKFDQEVILKVKRKSGTNKEIAVVAAKKLIEGGEEVGFIGIQYKSMPLPKDYVRKLQFGPVEAFYKALHRTKDYIVLTVQFLKKLFTGKMSLGHIAGPVTIAKYAGETVRSGIEYFASFLALVSISLGVLNMLPIPILDGGSFVGCIVEKIIGRPVPEKVSEISRYFGVFFLVFIMVLALHNDIIKF